MNPEHNDGINDQASYKPISEVELEAATNATFDAWTQSSRDFYKGARKLVEDLDDHTTILLTDIFGKDVAKEHSLRLEEEASREAAAGHTQAAHHFNRRDLNFSRSTLGEFDVYSMQVSKCLNTETGGDHLSKLEALLSTGSNEKFDALLKKTLHQ